MNSNKRLTGQAKGFDALEAALINNANAADTEGKAAKAEEQLASQGIEPEVNEPIVQEEVNEVTTESEQLQESEDSEEIKDSDEVVETTPEVEDKEDSAEPELIDDWDDGSESPIQEETKQIDLKEVYKDIAKELEVDADGIDELSILVDKLKQKSEAQKESVLEGVPEKLKEAIELAKQGIDYSEYLQVTSVDYNQIPDVDLYANAIAHNFQDETGAVNEDKLTEYLDSLSDSELAIRAGQLRNQLVSAQNNAKENLKRDAKERQEATEKGITNFLNEFSDVQGFKVSVDQKNKIKNSVVNDTLVKDMFYTEGKMDFGKISKAKFVVDNFDKIVKYLRVNGKTEGKRSVVEKMTNPERRPTGEAPLAGERQKKELEGLELMISDLKKHYKN